LALAGGWWWGSRQQAHFLPAENQEFIALFAAPPAADSAQTRDELDQLLTLQAARSAADIAAARADRKTRVTRFYAALGLDLQNPPDLPKLKKLAQYVEDDVRIHVRQVKEHFRRLRPYEIEPRIEPCIADVRGDLSYPSGHAAFGWSMAYLLSRLVPERQDQLETRAAQFARQRMVCGVHFPSDLEAGRRAARRLLEDMEDQPRFQELAAAAAAELRDALRLPPLPPAPRTPAGS
jgi:acid phosphatase (class A)